MERVRTVHKPTEVALGIDPGWSISRPSTGLAAVHVSQAGVVLRTRRCVASSVQRQAAIWGVTNGIVPLAVTVDGPLGPALGRLPPGRPRACERVLMGGAFGRVCRPVDWRNPLRGRKLHRAAMGVAKQVLKLATSGLLEGQHTMPLTAESFPDAFMAVCLELDTLQRARARPGHRTDGLFAEWIGHGNGAQAVLSGILGRRAASALIKAMAQVRNKDERAAVVCAVAALCLAHDRYCLLGDPQGGYVLLPQPELWAGWAIAEVSTQADRLKREDTCVELLLADGTNWLSR